MSIAFDGEPEHLVWIGPKDLANGVRLFPNCLKEALATRWQGVRCFVENGGRGKPHQR